MVYYLVGGVEMHSLYGVHEYVLLATSAVVHRVTMKQLRQNISGSSCSVQVVPQHLYWMIGNQNNWESRGRDARNTMTR